MSSTPILIGLASYLLPHDSFPWRHVCALVHYDAASGEQLDDRPVECTPIVRQLIQQGHMQNWWSEGS